jgi:hypothetical protein
MKNVIWENHSSIVTQQKGLVACKNHNCCEWMNLHTLKIIFYRSSKHLQMCMCCVKSNLWRQFDEGNLTNNSWVRPSKSQKSQRVKALRSPKGKKTQRTKTSRPLRSNKIQNNKKIHNHWRAKMSQRTHIFMQTHSQKNVSSWQFLCKHTSEKKSTTSREENKLNIIGKENFLKLPLCLATQWKPHIWIW